MNTLIDYLDLTIIILFVGSCVVIPLWLDSIIPYITWEFLLLPFFFLTSYLIFLKLYYDKNVENTGVASLYDIKKSLTIFLLKQGRPVLTWLLLLWTQIFFVLVYAVLDGFYIFTPPYILLLPLGAMGIVFTIQLTLSVLSSSWQGKEFWLLKIYFLFIIFEAFLVLLCINLERNVNFF